MILCGWCGKPTPDAPRCESCGHSGPGLPWAQRGEQPPPAVSGTAQRVAEARRRLGPAATAEQVAEAADVSPRTVRRWQPNGR